MANSSTVQTGISTLIQDNIGDQIVSVLFQRFVILYLLMRKNGDKQGVFGIGRPMVDGKPNTGVFVAGDGLATVRKETVMGALEFKPPIQYQELQDYTSEIANLHDNDTSVENWEDNQIESTIIRPSFRWSITQTPVEVSQMNMRMTKRSVPGTERDASKAVGDIWTSHTKMALAQHCRNINSRMIGSSTPSTTTDAPTSITSDLWSRQYSIPSILHTSNNWAGIDRALAGNAWARANRNTTSQSLNIRDMLNYGRYTAGLSNFGLFIDVLIMGNDLFPSAIAQVDALKGQVFYQGGFPDFPVAGYKKQVAIYDGVMIVNEPNWPAGYVAGLSLDTWFCAIHPDANFTASEPEKQNKIAGGHRSVAATIETQWMYNCIWPAGNVIWTTVTA